MTSRATAVEAAVVLVPLDGPAPITPTGVVRPDVPVSARAEGVDPAEGVRDGQARAA